MSEDFADLEDNLRGYTIDWDDREMADASTTRIEPLCGFIRQCADAISTLRRERDEAREALAKIVAIENRSFGPDYEEIEEARAIARSALSPKETT